MVRGIFLFLLLIGCSSDPPTDPQQTEPAPITWGLVSSTAQLVNEVLDPAICQSGWTRLKEDLDGKSQGHLPPLQKDYVKRFETLRDFATAAANVKPLLGEAIGIIRISTMWPCWSSSADWPGHVDQAIHTLQQAGWTVELSLLQRDSYPTSLHGSDGFGLGGWAHDNAPDEFVDYVERVLEKLYGRLPPLTRIYLANEPVSALFEGYLNGEGKWPPGGKAAGKSLGKALINMRDAFKRAGSKVYGAGHVPAVSVNIRPMTSKDTDEAKTLDLVRNWWLLNGVVMGCNDDNFSGLCNRDKVGPIDEIGLTFYGTMSATDAAVNIADGVPMSLPDHNFVPNAFWFGEALSELYGVYDVSIGVSEVGFSSGSTDKMETWLQEYKSRVGIVTPKGDSTFIQIHTLFESAEFSAGEWYFHMAEGCNGSACKLTPWGERALAVISEN